MTLGRTEEAELAAFTKTCLTKLSSLKVALEVEDAIGDTYARTMDCLRGAHRFIEFKEGVSLKPIDSSEYYCYVGRAIADTYCHTRADADWDLEPAFSPTGPAGADRVDGQD